jgi:hypothetical protein
MLSCVRLLHQHCISVHDNLVHHTLPQVLKCTANSYPCATPLPGASHNQSIEKCFIIGNRLWHRQH